MICFTGLKAINELYCDGQPQEATGLFETNEPIAQLAEHQSCRIEVSRSNPGQF